MKFLTKRQQNKGLAFLVGVFLLLTVVLGFEEQSAGEQGGSLLELKNQSILAREDKGEESGKAGENFGEVEGVDVIGEIIEGGEILGQENVTALIEVEVSDMGEELVWYPVVRVVDGDTVRIKKDGEEVVLRLIGVDTPEVVDPRKPVQCFGQEASDYAKKLLTGQKVRVEIDPTQDEYDRYGRWLVYMYLEDGLFFNEHIIKAGYAFEYTYQKPYQKQVLFKSGEAEAKAEKRGLWADGVCD